MNQSITIIKVVATIFVLFIHGANIFGYAGTEMPVYFRPFSALMNTAVPLFFIISGYLVFRKEADFKTNLMKKWKRLGIPFFIWNSIYFVLEMLVLPRLGIAEKPVWGGYSVV